MNTKETENVKNFRKLFPRKFIPLDASEDEVFSRSMQEILNAYKVYNPIVKNMLIEELGNDIPRLYRAITFAVGASLINQFEAKPEKIGKWCGEVAKLKSYYEADGEIERILSFIAYAYPIKGTEIYRATHVEMSAKAMKYLARIDAYNEKKCDKCVGFSYNINDDAIWKPEKLL